MNSQAHNMKQFEAIVKKTAFVVLAAGKGTRMYSDLPKVLHPLLGRPMLAHIFQALAEINVPRENLYTLIHSGKEAIEAYFADQGYCFIDQGKPLGTGHALQVALPHLKNHEYVLVLLGDTPLITAQTLSWILTSVDESPGLVVTAKREDAKGYGRIIRDSVNRILEIVEERDATDVQKNIHEVNTGLMFLRRELLEAYLPKLTTNNQQGEYYLTDLVRLVKEDDLILSTCCVSEESEVMGANNLFELAQLEDLLEKREKKKLMLSGVRLIKPDTLMLQGTLTAGKNVVIEPGVVIKGTVELGDDVYIEAYSVLKDVKIGARSSIRSHSVLVNSVLGECVDIGPFAKLRPHNQLADEVKIGSFVEIKASTVGQGTKIPHLSYVGDASIGSQSNIGAGAITCNYDGHTKHRTYIGDHNQIGANVSLVAPIEIANNVTIAAGSVITKSVSESGLVIARESQIFKPNWKKPKNQHS